MAEERFVDFEQEDAVDIKSFLIKCFRQWYLFAGFLIMALLLATLVNQFSVPEYRVTANLLIRDEENPLDPQKFIGTSLYGNPYQLQNEIGMLQSKSLTRRALGELDFYVSYYQKARFTITELYNQTPFLVAFDTTFLQPLNVVFDVVFTPDTQMIVTASAAEAIGYHYMQQASSVVINGFEFADTLAFGDLTGNQYCRFRIIPNFGMLHLIGSDQRYSFRFNSMSQLISAFRVSEVEATKNSSILSISLRCGNVQKGVDYLNKLNEVFLKKGIERNDKIALSTIRFIDEQLKGITDSLRYSEDRLQHFRSTRGATNIDFQAQQTYQQMEELQDQQAELMVKSKYYSYLRDYLMKNNQVEDLIAPSSMDISDPLLNNLIIELTRLYTERTEMSFNTIKNNPYLTSLEMKISDIKANLLENIDNIIKASDISLKELSSRITDIESTISALPGSQRELLVIERKFKLNDAIYTYLLTKRSEVQISKASNIPSNEVLDGASADDYVKVSPNVRMNYILAMLIGLFLPALLVYFRDYFRDKITDRKEIQQVTGVDIIGNILHNPYKTTLVVHGEPNSMIAESFRTLRTNFQFFPDSGGKYVVLITSVINGEGKSFTAVNLGSVFAKGGHKTVIIDFDLRKAKIRKYLDIDTSEGLSRYLSGRVSLDEIVFPTEVELLDVIPSGPIPPNPLELISSDHTTRLFDELKQRYHVVIVDSPPIALVSDSLLLLRHASVKLIVARQQYTPRSLFVSVMEDLEKRKAGPFHVVLNDNKSGLNGYGYGYNYGYGYGHAPAKRGLIQRISGLFSRG